MNERIIWDFVSKARECALSDTSDGGKCFDQDVFHNKFAELIVRECVSVAHPKLNDVGEWAAGMRLVQKRIKQHFGVEE
jgi:hypothetical protein